MSTKPIPALLGALLLLASHSGGLDRQTAPPSWPAEQRHDQQMWALLQQALRDFGYTNQAQALQQAWQRTRTPQQWAEDKLLAAPEIAVSPQAEQIAARCAGLTSLSEALQIACSQPAGSGEIIAGLWLWTRQGGAPRLQGRTDLALHFIHAALYESLFGLGEAAAVAKEQLDQAEGKPFDWDDLAASLAGALWVQRARQDPDWRQAWASGAKNLERNLPELRYGTGMKRTELLEQIPAEIAAALMR